MSRKAASDAKWERDVQRALSAITDRFPPFHEAVSARPHAADIIEYLYERGFTWAPSFAAAFRYLRANDNLA